MFATNQSHGNFRKDNRQGEKKEPIFGIIDS